MLLLLGAAIVPLIPAQYQSAAFSSGSSSASSASGATTTIFLSGQSTATFEEN